MISVIKKHSKWSLTKPAVSGDLGHVRTCIGVWIHLMEYENQKRVKSMNSLLSLVNDQMPSCVLSLIHETYYPIFHNHNVIFIIIM